MQEGQAVRFTPVFDIGTNIALPLNGNHHHYHHDHDYHQIPEEVQEGEALPRRQVEVQAHQRCPVHAGLQWYLNICICICNIFVFVHIWIFDV